MIKKKLSLVTMFLTSVFIASCTASGNVTVNPTPTPTAMSTSTPQPSATATASPAVTASPTANPGTIVTFRGNFSGDNEVPKVSTGGTGNATLTINTSTKVGTLEVRFLALSSGQTGAHIHGPAAVGEEAGVLIGLPNGEILN